MPLLPGVDSQWEMRLYGLVRTGARREAVLILEETRGLPRKDAAKRVAAELGVIGRVVSAAR